MKKKIKKMAKIKKFNEPDKFDWLDKVSQNACHVRDGVWNITGMEHVTWEHNFSDAKYEEFKIFVEKFPKFCIAHPYNTENEIWISDKPTKKVSFIGDGFNYGSNNIFDIKEPTKILICAEND